MRKNKGFTLVELMITVAIVGILASIAIPAYSDHVAKSRRADAKAALSQLAQAMERYYTEKSTYVGATVGSGANAIFPSEAPLDGGTKYYDLSISAQTATNFQVTATPKGPQAGDGNLTLNLDGSKTWGTKTYWD
jgi:type IV pilus assembly protein PilE